MNRRDVQTWYIFLTKNGQVYGFVSKQSLIKVLPIFRNYICQNRYARFVRHCNSAINLLFGDSVICKPIHPVITPTIRLSHIFIVLSYHLSIRIFWLQIIGALNCSLCQNRPSPLSPNKPRLFYWRKNRRFQCFVGTYSDENTWVYWLFLAANSTNQSSIIK